MVCGLLTKTMLLIVRSSIPMAKGSDEVEETVHRNQRSSLGPMLRPVNTTFLVVRLALEAPLRLA